MSRLSGEARFSAFALGLTIYIVSFLLVATGPDPHRGWNDAAMALYLPLEEVMRPPDVEAAVGPILLVAIAVSGWINVVFLFATMWGLFARAKAPFKVLRVIVLLMMPFPWVVFSFELMTPREGYFLWTAGILLVLFSDRLGQPNPSRR